MSAATVVDPAAEVAPLGREEGEELAGRICAHAARQARDSCDLLILIGEFDAGQGWGWSQGFKSVAHWLAWACAMTPATAREHVRVARALRRMPTVTAAFGAGELSYSKVREVTRVVDVLDEARVCELARYATASQLARMISSYRAAAGTRIRAEGRRLFRLIGRDGDPMTAVTGRLPAEEAAIVTAALERARDLNGLPPAAPTGPESAVDPDQHDATPPYTDADAFLDVCRHYLATADAEDESGEDRSLVIIEVAAEQLALAEVPAGVTAREHPVTLGQVATIEMGDVPAGTPHPYTFTTRTADAGEASAGTGVLPTIISPAVRDGDVPAGTPQPPGIPSPTTDAEDVPAGTRPGTVDRADQPEVRHPPTPHPGNGKSSLRAQVCTVRGAGPIEPQTPQRMICTGSILGAIVDRHGDVLALGRTRRLVSKRQRRALLIRDQVCQFPGCWRDRRLQAHHRVPWSHGGTTDLANLILLCGFHHTAVHEGGITISRRIGAPYLGARTGDPGWRFLLPDGQPVAETGWRVRTADQLVQDLSATRPSGPNGQDPPAATTIRTVGGGEGFSLRNCVEALFSMTLDQDHAAA